MIKTYLRVAACSNIHAFRRYGLRLYGQGSILNLDDNANVSGERIINSTKNHTRRFETTPVKLRGNHASQAPGMRAAKKTGTRPCLCKQCDVRRKGLGGLNTKGREGLGGVALKSVPVGAARRRLLDDLVRGLHTSKYYRPSSCFGCGVFHPNSRSTFSKSSRSGQLLLLYI